MFPPFESESLELIVRNHRANNLLANTDASMLYLQVLTTNFEPLVKFCTKGQTAQALKMGMHELLRSIGTVDGKCKRLR